MTGETSLKNKINGDSCVHYVSWKTTCINNEIFLYGLSKWRGQGRDSINLFAIELFTFISKYGWDDHTLSSRLNSLSQKFRVGNSIRQQHFYMLSELLHSAH